MVPVSDPMLPPTLRPIRQVADRTTETHTLDQAQEEHVAQEGPDHQRPDLDHQTTRDRRT